MNYGILNTYAGELWRDPTMTPLAFPTRHQAAAYVASERRKARRGECEDFDADESRIVPITEEV